VLLLEEGIDIPLDKEFEAVVIFVESVLSTLFDCDDFTSLGVPYKKIKKSFFNNYQTKHLYDSRSECIKGKLKLPKRQRN
jgi:hypothetical protein